MEKGKCRGGWEDSEPHLLGRRVWLKLMEQVINLPWEVNKVSNKTAKRDFNDQVLERGWYHFSYCAIIFRILKAATKRNEKSLKIFLGLGKRSMIWG